MQPNRTAQPLSKVFTPLANFLGWLVNPSASLVEIGRRRQAQLSASMSLLLFVLLFARTLAIVGTQSLVEPVNLIMEIFGLVLLVAYIFSRTNLPSIGASILSIGFSAIGYAIILANMNQRNSNISGAIYATIPIALVLANALLPLWGLGLLVIVNTVLIALLPMLIPAYANSFTDAGIVLSIGGLLLIISYYRGNTEKQRLDEIRASNTELQSANAELHEIRGTLEQRVSERTSELEAISAGTTRRANELQGVALVGRAITSIQNLEELLPRITSVISEQFSFYHVGIFLLNDKKDFAVLQAANSEGGQKMLEAGHKLPVGELGIVGNVAANGFPRIALNTGVDPVYFDNPYLPATQSEMALPLKIGSEIIGVLDMQSDQPSAFSSEDVNLITILADQISIAIRNARSFDEAQKAIIEAENISGQYLRKEWRDISTSAKTPGFKYSSAGIKSLERPLDSVDIIHAAKSGENVHVDGENGRKMTIPIKLRGQVMGVVNVQIPAGRKWAQNELEITQAIADRVAIAIENARLFQDAQRRASRELAISEISSKITSSIQVESILRTAAEELSLALSGSEVLVQLETGASRSSKE